MPPGTTLLSTADAARIYGVPVRTMRYWIARSRIVKHGRRGYPRYQWADVDVLAAEHGR